MAYTDYYKILGVARTASQDEISSAYRKLARKYHPDISKAPDAEERFKELGNAYDVLKDPEKRQLYDQYGEDWKAVSEGRAPPHSADQARVDFSGAGFDPEAYPDLGSIFETFFGGRRGVPGGGGRRVVIPGGDIEAELGLSIEEAFTGGERQLSLASSDGSTKTYRVKIPAGVRSGQRIRLAEQGQPGIGGGPPGDLYLRVRVRSSDRFRLEDADVHTSIPVTPWEAALGTTVTLPVLDGTVRLKIPAGSSSGRRLRLAGRGYPADGGQRGNLYAEVQIVIPDTLDAKEQELMKELAAHSKFRARPWES